MTTRTARSCRSGMGCAIVSGLAVVSLWMVPVVHAGEGPDMELVITSHAFENGQKIPRRHTCQGDDVSPPLAWSGVPDDALSLVLIVDDPDAPDPAHPTMTWVHWVLYDMPATSTGLDEDVAPSELPTGTRQGLNDWKRPGYGGPCPPIGRHRYFFKLYALDTALGDQGAATTADLERAMRGHVLAEAVLMGTYQKGD